MAAATIELAGRRYVVLPEAEYERLRRQSNHHPDSMLPDLPPANVRGNLPAVAALRVTLARKIIQRRAKAGLSQAQLARRAHIRPETLNRIEKAKVTADTATITKITRVLDQASLDSLPVEQASHTPPE